MFPLVVEHFLPLFFSWFLFQPARLLLLSDHSTAVCLPVPTSFVFWTSHLLPMDLPSKSLYMIDPPLLNSLLSFICYKCFSSATRRPGMVGNKLSARWELLMGSKHNKVGWWPAGLTQWAGPAVPTGTTLTRLGGESVLFFSEYASGFFYTNNQHLGWLMKRFIKGKMVRNPGKKLK